MPLVSVIIPTFNRANRLTEAVDSVFQQTLRDFEIIIVDDGSRDNTRDIVLRKYGNKIRYLYLEHKGVPRRNAGIKVSKGKYIAFLDDDDLWLHEKLSRQIDLMKKVLTEVGMVYCSSYEQKGKVLNIINAEHRGNVIKNILLENVIQSTSVVLIKRECFDRVGLFDESLQISEDLDLWIRISRYYHVDFVPEPLIIIRRLGKHRHTVSEKNRSTFFMILDRLLNDPDCPDDIKILRKKAYASRFLRFMGGIIVIIKYLELGSAFLRHYFMPLR